MSHLATIKTEIKDIEAIKRACAELGFTFEEGKTQFGMMKESKSGYEQTHMPCSHVISHPKWELLGIRCDVGLVKTTTGYKLKFDELLQGHDKFLAGIIDNVVIGIGASKLMQLYGVHKATLEAKRLGYAVKRKTVATGAIHLTVTGM